MANRDLHWRHKYEEAGLLKPRGRTLTQKRALYKEVTEEEWGPPLMTYGEAQAARAKALGGPAEFADWDAYEKATARMLELEALQPKRPEPDKLAAVAGLPLEIIYIVVVLLAVASTCFINLSMGHHAHDQQQTVRSAYKASCERINHSRITINKISPGHRIPLANCRAF